MTDETDYAQQFLSEHLRRYPPRHKQPAPPEGEDFDTLTAKHGRPRGPFELHDKPLRKTKSGTEVAR